MLLELQQLSQSAILPFLALEDLQITPKSCRLVLEQFVLLLNADKINVPPPQTCRAGPDSVRGEPEGLENRVNGLGYPTGITISRESEQEEQADAQQQQDDSYVTGGSRHDMAEGATRLLDQDIFQGFEVVEDPPRAHHYGGERIVRENDRETCLPSNKFIDVPQQ